MATTAPTYDPKTTAAGLAQAYVKDRQDLLTKQTDAAKAEASALGTLRTAMNTFDGLLSSMSLKKSVVANTATLSQSIGSGSASATAAAGQYSFFVQQVATAHQVSYQGISNTTPMSEAGTVTVNIGGDPLDPSFAVDLTTADKSGDGKLSVQEIAAAINSAADNKSRVTASTVTVNGVSTLVLTSANTGELQTVSLDAGSTTGALAAAIADPLNYTEMRAAQDAIVYIGVDATGTQVKQASNTITAIDGLSVTFNQASASPVTVTVARDPGGTAANVQAFVEGWNKLIAMLQALTKNGTATTAPAVFASDSGVEALITTMQATLRKAIGNQSLVTYGISAQRDGTLALDTVRLDKALAANPTTLDTIFGSATSGASSGVLGGLNELMDGWLKVNGQLNTRRDSNTKLQANLDRAQTRIEDQYNSAYDRYLKQFTQLQTLQAQMNSNTSLFDSLFGDKKDS